MEHWRLHSHKASGRLFPVFAVLEKHAYTEICEIYDTVIFVKVHNFESDTKFG